MLRTKQTYNYNNILDIHTNIHKSLTLILTTHSKWYTTGRSVCSLTPTTLHVNSLAKINLNGNLGKITKQCGNYRLYRQQNNTKEK